MAPFSPPALAPFLLLIAKIGSFKQAPAGTYSVIPKEMTRRGMTYNWKVSATDGTNTAQTRASFNLVYHFGDGRQVILVADCHKYGYLKHGWEKGKVFATVQRGMWASYDIDRGWDGTFQRLFRETGNQKGGYNPNALDDGGYSIGHTFWGYWDGAYHVLGIAVVYYSKDAEKWDKSNGRVVATGMSMKPHGTGTPQITAMSWWNLRLARWILCLSACFLLVVPGQPFGTKLDHRPGAMASCERCLDFSWRPYRTRNGLEIGLQWLGLQNPNEKARRNLLSHRALQVGALRFERRTSTLSG